MFVTEEVIHRAAIGNRDAQRQIYESVSDRVYRIVRRIVGSSDADDVTQDVFLRLFAKLYSYRQESEFTTWLHRLVVNEALQHVRRKSRPAAKSRTLVEKDLAQVDEDTDGENSELLEKAMARIDPELRLIFELKEIDRLPYMEIAKIIGIPEGTVGSRLNRARKELREQLLVLGWEP